MKRFVILALALAFVMSAAVANAGEVAQKGEIHFNMGWTDNLDFMDNGGEGNQEDDLQAESRARHYIDFITSETLKMTLGFEYDMLWGNNVDRGADDNLFELKRAQLAWVVPNTGLNMVWGVQGLALPAAVGGNPIYNDDAPGITASYKFNDMLAATAFWMRFENDEYGSTASEAAAGQQDDESDIFGLVLPVSLDGASFSPYFVYGMIGNDVGTSHINPGVSATTSTTAYWVGTDLKVSAFDPIVFLADLQYGQSNNDGDDTNEASGWRVDAALAYKMDMMTPTVIFNYGSGNDSDASNGFEVMPYVQTSSNWGVSNMGTAGGNGGTNTGQDAILTQSGAGLVALGFALADIKLLDGMTNDVRLLWYKGTCDVAQGENYSGLGFSDEDTAWEFNFDTEYQLYENLSAGFEIGYISVDYDDNAGARATDAAPDAASKLLFFLDYSF